MTTKKSKPKPKTTAAKNQATRFAKMTPAQKRVAIAYDVIAGLKAKRLVATPGIYVQLLAKSNMVTQRDIDKGVELQAKFAKVKKCHVCALGGVFVAAVDRFNDIRCSDNLGMEVLYNAPHLAHANGYIEPTPMFDYLTGLFSRKQLTDIESAFEDYADHPWSSKLHVHADRMTAIMQNVIRNRGRFNMKQFQTQEAR